MEFIFASMILVSVLSAIGFYFSIKKSMKDLAESQEKDKLFLKWVCREVEWVVDDSGEQDVWEFEFNHGNECKYIDNAKELRKYWEDNFSPNTKKQLL